MILQAAGIKLFNSMPYTTTKLMPFFGDHIIAYLYLFLNVKRFQFLFNNTL